MRRRDLVGGVVAAATGAAGYVAGRSLRPEMRRVDWKPLALSYPLAAPRTDPGAYFTEELCRRELDVPALARDPAAR